MAETIQKLYVEASSRCNLRCKMCFRHSWVGECFGDLDPAVFARVMDDPVLQDTGTVFFGGMGEPLVHPALAEMAALASARGKQVEIAGPCGRAGLRKTGEGEGWAGKKEGEGKLEGSN